MAPEERLSEDVLIVPRLFLLTGLFSVLNSHRPCNLE
jgi:hypothetical protein